MFFTISVILLTIYLINHFLFRWKNADKIKLANQLNPGYVSFPIIGHSYLLLGNPETLLITFQSFGEIGLQNGGIMSLWILNELWIGINDPEMAQIILKNCLEKHEIIAKVARLLIGNATAFAPLSIWHHRRKLIAPTFGSKNLIKYVSIFDEKAHDMVKELQQVAGKGNFPIWKYISAYSMDSICESTMGVNVNAQREPKLAEVMNALKELFRMATSDVVKPWMNNPLMLKLMPYIPAYRKGIRVIDEFIDKIIQSKREEVKEKHRKTNTNQLHENEDCLKSFLELYIESNAFINEELVEEIKIMLIAGSDTTATSISFTIAMLARHPDIQEKVYKELCEVFGDSTDPINAKDIAKLKYLEMVIKESLRLYPPAPIIMNQVDEDIEIRPGLILPKNCGVAINIMALHRNPKYWGADAEIFRPERFINEAPEHPVAFMPFSHGPRGCAGHQYAMFSAKTALASLLRQYRILPPAEPQNGCQGGPTTASYRPLRLTFQLLLKDKDQFVVQLENRNKVL